MSSWTDLSISDALKKACSDVREQTKSNFAAFVQDSLKGFGVEKYEQLSLQQKKQLEEHIAVNWKNYIKENDDDLVKVDSEGRTTVKEQKAEVVNPTKVEIPAGEEHKGETEGDNEADKINKITDANSQAVVGKVVAEPGVKTAAQATLSPGEKERLVNTAKKLGLA